jgi:hypothetical protein
MGARGAIGLKRAIDKQTIYTGMPKELLDPLLSSGSEDLTSLHGQGIR